MWDNPLVIAKHDAERKIRDLFQSRFGKFSRCYHCGFSNCYICGFSFCGHRAPPIGECFHHTRLAGYSAPGGR